MWLAEPAWAPCGRSSWSPSEWRGWARIFERFRSGEWEADDEVAVVHGTAEDGFRVMSDALANLTPRLEHARKAGVIQRATEVAMVAAAKAQFYAERSWASLFELGERLCIGSAELANLRRFVAQERPDAKRADALAVLARVRDRLDRDEPWALPDFDFECDRLLGGLIARARSIGASSGSGLSHEDLRPRTSASSRAGRRPCGGRRCSISWPSSCAGAAPRSMTARSSAPPCASGGGSVSSPQPGWRRGSRRSG